MRWLLCLLSAVLLIVSGQLALRAGDNAANYLKDGNLKERIEIHEVRLDGTDVEYGPKFIRTIYVVEPDGSWSTSRIGGKEPPVNLVPDLKMPPTRGKLTKEQLTELAKALARHDLASLPSHGAPTLGGHVEIHFGKKQSVAGDFTEKDKAIRARYEGIALAVKMLCQQPKGVSLPISAKLIAKKSTYQLDLGGKSAADFKKLLKDGEGDKLPKAPVVDLVLEFTNTSDKEVQFMVDGDSDKLNLELKGPGAVSIITYKIFTTDLKPSKTITLAPGKSYSMPIASLTYGFRGAAQAAYWTEPGDYTITARYHTGSVTINADPVKIKVEAPK